MITSAWSLKCYCHVPERHKNTRDNELEVPILMLKRKRIHSVKQRDPTNKHFRTLTPGIFSCPDANRNPFLDIDKHETSLVCPSKKLSLPLFIFLITINDPRGYSKYFPQGV
jgi:hypothetical protein